MVIQNSSVINCFVSFLTFPEIRLKSIIKMITKGHKSHVVFFFDWTMTIAWYNQIGIGEFQTFQTHQLFTN